MIPDDTVEEVRARAEGDIVAVIGEHVELKKSGKDYKARCPFHEDRTPSFYVVPAKGFYKCFGCGESGDAFSFVMKKLGLDFVEAVKHVGAKVGVDVREVARGSREEDPYRPFYEANAFARDFYRKCLEDEDLGVEARSYLEDRGLDADTVERFGLGYAPDEWRSLREAAAQHDMDDELLLRVGLLKTSEKMEEPYDTFRSRIVFPIEGTGSRVLAFGGRVLGEGRKGAPKYLNSPESPIFHKGEVLYGLSRARHEIRREEAALVVEGYMDVVALAARGVENAVAPLGTSLTEEHARLLARYCDRVYLLFDSDAAGLKATFRTADILLEAGLHPSVATLPPGEDPDSLVRKEGAEGIRAHLEQAVDVLDRKLQILEERDYFSTIDKTRDAVDRLLPTLRAAADPALRDIYVSKVADRTGVQRETLEREMEEGRGRERGREERTRGTGARSRPTRPAPRRRASAGGGDTLGLGPERELLMVLLHDRSRLPAAAEELSGESFRDAGYRGVWEALVEDPELDRMPDDASPQARRRFEQLMAHPEELSRTTGVFRDVLGMLKIRPLQQEAERLRAELARAVARGQDDEALGLTRELQDLESRGRAIHPSWRSAARLRNTPEP